jgi:hypothetical protein
MVKGLFAEVFIGDFTERGRGASEKSLSSVFFMA